LALPELLLEPGVTFRLVVVPDDAVHILKRGPNRVDELRSTSSINGGDCDVRESVTLDVEQVSVHVTDTLAQKTPCFVFSVSQFLDLLVREISSLLGVITKVFDRL
jgi:hypothetical protein